MTVFLDAATNTEPISQEVRYFIDANIRRLQQARLDKRKNATLADLFKGRNPYFLRATRKVAFELVSYCLDSYLLSVDENLFENFVRELSDFGARRGKRMLEPVAILDRFAQDDLPLLIELLEEYDLVCNRLLYQFYEEFCDENRVVDWERLAEFISSG
ncbi:MAG: PmeII family type II restriction endonuclease [Chloroflexi bacterium]|nr:PmeII family type II restriction endonuclease [Chloroflexota bacterium]